MDLEIDSEADTGVLAGAPPASGLSVRTGPRSRRDIAVAASEAEEMDADSANANIGGRFLSSSCEKSLTGLSEVLALCCMGRPHSCSAAGDTYKATVLSVTRHVKPTHSTPSGIPRETYTATTLIFKIHAAAAAAEKETSSEETGEEGGRNGAKRKRLEGQRCSAGGRSRAAAAEPNGDPASRGGVPSCCVNGALKWLESDLAFPVRLPNVPNGTLEVDRAR